MNNDSAVRYHSSNFGYWAIYIKESGAVVLSSDLVVNPFYKVHGFLMWGAWGVLGLVQLVTNRYLKGGNGWRYGMWAHRISGTLTLLITLVMAFLALKEGGWEVGNLHSVLGVIILSLVLLIVLGGVLNRSLMQRLRWRTKDVLRVKMVHRYFGYFMLILSEAAIVTGSLKYANKQGDNVNIPGLVHVFVFFIIILLVEGIFQKYRRGETPFVEPTSEEVISTEEFDKRVVGGEQLVILDDLILDVSHFMAEHPGGRFLIENSIGRDVSKYFYGGYVMENGVGLTPHRHSNVARSIVNKIVVGRLNNRAQTFTVRASASQVINHFAKVFIMRVEGPDPSWRAPSSTDVTQFGRHYLLRSFSRGKVKRHYSVASCMRNDAYQQYLGLVNQCRENPYGPFQFDAGVLPEAQKEPEVVFVCKNYRNEAGLSHRLHNDQNDLYQIKATLGKGLGVKESGTNIAFTAGTGILAFVDLAALILRANLGLIAPEELPPQFKPGSDFKFVLYVSFENKKDGIAFDLLCGLYEIT